MRYQRNLYNAEKYILGYNSVAVNTGLSSFVYLLLSPKYGRYGEISIELTLQQFKVIQGHRSWCQWKAHYVIVTLATILEIFTLEDRKLLTSPTPLFDAPARGNPLKFLDETYCKG